MLAAVERMITALDFVVQDTPIGTNISLLRLLWAMVNGSFLQSRGAVHGALSASNFSDEEIRRGWSALRYGAWTSAGLLSAWHIRVAAENEWRERRYGVYKVNSLDITGFWRPKLKGQVNQLYNATARRALPAMVFGVLVTSGEIKGKRVPLLQQIIRCEAETSETEFHGKLLAEVAKASLPDEITVMDAGFELSELVAAKLKRFVVRMAINCTARRNRLPAYKGRGAHPKYGECVRPLPRTRLTKRIAATPCDATGTFVYQGRTIRYESWHHLVTVTTPVAQANPTVSIHVFYDPYYCHPLVLATDIALPAETVYRVYRDRWTVEHPPLASKQMIGLHRQFVSAEESCQRLPELSLLAGNILTHVAATQPPIPTGFWDRSPQSTPGRLRRLLAKAIFPTLDELHPELRKKNSVSDHLSKGIDAHRRTKAAV
jgi:hypothetical protein